MKKFMLFMALVLFVYGCGLSTKEEVQLRNILAKEYNAVEVFTIPKHNNNMVFINDKGEVFYAYIRTDTTVRSEEVNVTKIK